MSGPQRRLAAAIFDLGGVVLESPLHFIERFEARGGLPRGFLADLLGSYGADGDSPWHALERGEIDLAAFCERFDREARSRGAVLDSHSLMSGIARYCAVRPDMVEAVRRLRASGIKTAALTNIWSIPGREGLDDRLASLVPEFDAFVESYRVGMRKPEAGIFAHVCEALGIEPEAAVFLDDIGTNLKAARTLGMHTIKVVTPEQALADLGAAVGLDLTP